MYTAPAPFPSFWSLIKSTFYTWYESWGAYSLINLVIVILGGIASFLIIHIIPWVKPLFTGGTIDADTLLTTYSSTSAVVYDLVGIICISVIFACAVILSQIMTINVLNPDIRLRGPRYVLSISLKAVPGYAWTTALLTLIVTGGFIFLFIPGIFLIPIIVTGIFVAAREHKTGLDAAVESSGYVRGRMLAVLWRSILIIIVVQGISLILPLLSALLIYPFTLFDVGARTFSILVFTAGTLYTFISLLLSIIMPSLLIIFYYHLYEHMRANPTGLPALSKKLLAFLAWFGFAVILSLAILEIIF